MRNRGDRVSTPDEPTPERNGAPPADTTTPARGVPRRSDAVIDAEVQSGGAMVEGDPLLPTPAEATALPLLQIGSLGGNTVCVHPVRDPQHGRLDPDATALHAVPLASRLRGHRAGRAESRHHHDRRGLTAPRRRVPVLLQGHDRCGSARSHPTGVGRCVPATRLSARWALLRRR